MEKISEGEIRTPKHTTAKIWDMRCEMCDRKQFFHPISQISHHTSGSFIFSYFWFINDL